MNKIIIALLTLSLTLIGATTYKVYKLSHKASDLQKLDVKFGTSPTSPKYKPIVHLADLNR